MEDMGAYNICIKTEPSFFKVQFKRGEVQLCYFVNMNFPPIHVVLSGEINILDLDIFSEGSVLWPAGK